MNEFEKYPELCECLQEYAAYGKFNNWSRFTRLLNEALTRESPDPIPADIEQEAEDLYPKGEHFFMGDGHTVKEMERAAYVKGYSKCAGRMGELEAENARLKDEIDFLFKYLPKEYQDIIKNFKPTSPL